ncbi:uncharacterized protein LOC129959245 [Argiope bruennichi]|uniref:uncharacterized protein LOC129959245 n=1 Tax=Argiope bruennichi TaxID=94029 RepID=UPI002494897D|nr:uncharacterized protein LOC129959245 [Argiope bruennichi]
MFLKQEQRSWIKIERARGRTARQCHLGLQEACGESALPYRIIARWVKAFNEGRQNVAEVHAVAQHPIDKATAVFREGVVAVTALMNSDRCQTIHELTRQTRFAHTTVLHILKECLGMRKIASRWVPHHLTEIQK